MFENCSKFIESDPILLKASCKQKTKEHFIVEIQSHILWKRLFSTSYEWDYSFTIVFSTFVLTEGGRVAKMGEALLGYSNS